MKAVVDSSVLVSAFLTPGGTPGQVLAAGLRGRFAVILSEPILAETARASPSSRRATASPMPRPSATSLTWQQQ